MKEKTDKTIEKAIRLYEVLLILKEKCDNGDFKKGIESVSDFVHKNGFKASAYISAINSLKIIYKDELFYSRWNQKIPVSVKLAVTIVKKCSEIQKLHGVSYRAKKQQIKPETKITLPISDKNKIENFSKSGKRCRKPLHKEIKNHSPKVGLIRRFLRWIY